ncbi:MAG: hypothetical protein RSA49_03095 [Anaerovoracaceae bacterium]
MNKIKLLIVIVVMALLLVSCGNSTVDKPSMLIETPKTYGDVLNGFKVPDLGGKPVSDSLIKEKKYSLVVLWSTECQGCEDTLKVINKLSNKYGDGSLGFLGIMTDSVNDRGKLDKKAIRVGRHKLSHWNIDFTNITVPIGIKEAVMPDVFLLPASFLVDHNGDVVSQFYPGNVPYEEWDQMISELID